MKIYGGDSWLLHFALNLLRLWRKVRSHEHLYFHEQYPGSPNSFMGYFFVNNTVPHKKRAREELFRIIKIHVIGVPYLFRTHIL